MSHPISLIILTWNGIAYTRRCLDSIRRYTTAAPYRIIVVDNGSTDETLAFIRTQPDIMLIANDSNVGFARANNQAIAAMPEADVVLLNNDTEIPADQGAWLERLQRTAYSADDIGIVGCRLRRQNGMLQHAGAYMPLSSFWGQQIGSNELDINQYSSQRDVESVVFACVYIKRAVIDKIGGLCEDYFAYFEDTDYCNTARAAGFRTVCSGDVTVIHHENSSTKENKVSHRQLFETSRSIYKRKWAAAMRARYERKVVWHSTVSRPHGYAMTSKDLLLQLDAQNVEVTYRYLYGRGTVFPVDEPEQTDYYLVNEMKHRAVPRGVPHVVYGQGDAFQSNPGAYKIGYTMLEVTGLPKEWVRQSNVMDEVWVPTEFNRETFRSAGVTRPIHVMPLGVDVNYFNPRILNYPVSSDFKFLSIFEWGERKAQEVLLKAFNDTFRADEPVVLLCKANCTDPSVDVRGVIQGLNLSAQGGRIEFILNKYVPYYQLGALYRSADCFVLPTRGEGWGMPVLEAMACGLPAICTFWSAPTAFMSERNSYPLNVKRLIDAVAKCPYYTGFQWADPDEEHLRFLLRHVFEHQDEARAIGAHAAADVAAHWTVTHAAARIKQRLGEIEQERGLPNVTITTATPSRSTIAIDVSRTIGEQITGVGRYTLNIVQGLAEYPTDDAEFLLLPGFGGFVHPEYGKRYRCVAPATPNMRVYDGPLPAYASPDHLVPGVDLLHCTGNMVAPVGDTPCLMTIFDVSFLTHPEFHTWENINLCKHNFEQAVRRGAWFTAISQHSKNDFLRHYQVPPERVIVVPCTYDHHRYTPCSAAAIQRARQAYGLPDRYLLLLASLEPRKNAVTALRAVAARDIGVPLVIAGAKGWMNDALQCDIARAGTRVQNIGYVAEDDLPAVYSGAHGLVFPTLYEGFGLPVLEAMACGTPVITTRVASLPEVAGTAALYVDDPLDVDSLADAMQRLVQDTQLHARLHADGLTQAQRFQRQPIIARLLQAYRTVMEG